MKHLYIDATNSGISGDMFLAALLELVPNPEAILGELEKLQDVLSGVSELRIKLEKVKCSGIQVNQLNLTIKESKNHRTAKALQSSLKGYLDKITLSNRAKDYANRVLGSLIQAEKEIHGELTERIHLHELSSVDTLVDIIGVTKALDSLDCFNDTCKILCSKIPLGGGTIKAAHGELPIPAPATLKILQGSKLNVFNGPIDSELVTPTGAALLVNLNPESLPFDMRIDKVVYSTGQKRFTNFLNVLRLFYGEAEQLNTINLEHSLKKYIEPVTVIETNIDDASGEIIGNFISNFQNEDILDIQIVPSLTKKNRPGHIIKILCRPSFTFKIISKIIKELGTLGVRYTTINRVCVDRTIQKVKIQINQKDYDVTYKISFIEYENKKDIVNIKPEYEDLKKVSADSGLSLKEVLAYAQAKIQTVFKDFRTE